MKTRKLISIVLLLAMGFSSLHAFAIDFLDEDHCEVSSYVQEFSQSSDHDEQGDICKIHHEFHIAFVLPEITLLPLKIVGTSQPIATLVKHDYQTYHYFLKPPITLI